MKKKIRVLHIDDNLHDRMLIKDALLSIPDKFEVVQAEDEQSFITHLNNKDFDIVLSDFNILGFDGLEVIQLIKEKYPDMPVIIVTGTGSEIIALEAMKMGASDYVIKSVNHIRGLSHSIETVLQNRKIKNDRKKALVALKKSEEKYRKIFENVQDVFYQTNKDGIITEVSPSVFHASGFHREEILGKPAAELYVNPADRTTLIEILSKHGEIWDFETRIKTKQGNVKYASLNAHLIYNKKGEPSGIEGSLRDVTDRKLVEQELIAAKEKAEESDRLKTAFLHNISHEIRTPMNSIVGFAELINDPEIPAGQRMEFTDIIVKSSNHLLSIITDIVSIATIEAGQEKVFEREVNLNSIFFLVYEQFLPEAKKKNISLSLAPLLPDHEVLIHSDETKLIQIISNLIGNAIKFTKEGYVQFGYQIDEAEDKENMLRFFVEDTGIGIPINMQEEIFDRFRQVENATKRNYGGSGLGLSISKAYVELLGGKMWLVSELGVGSGFYFTIPYKTPEL